MRKEQIEDRRKLPLRIVAPDVYEGLMKTLDELHVHPYDVKADAMKKDNGLLLTISYGAEFSQTETQFFTYDTLKRMDDEVVTFFHEIKKACHKVLMCNYFQTMNPLKLKEKG